MQLLQKRTLTKLEREFELQTLDRWPSETAPNYLERRRVRLANYLKNQLREIKECPQ